MVYEHFSWKTDSIATSNRADVGLLQILRSGHAPLLKAYTHLLDPAAEPTCPLCKEEYALLDIYITIGRVQWKYLVNTDFATNSLGCAYITLGQKIIQFQLTQRHLSCPAFMNNDFLHACILSITPFLLSMTNL